MSVLDEPLLPEDEAARELKVKPQTLGAWRFRGQGPVYVKIGKLVFYRPSDIRAYVASRIVRPTDLAAEAEKEHRAVENHFKQAVVHAIKAGEALNEAKNWSSTATGTTGWKRTSSSPPGRQQTTCGWLPYLRKSETAFPI